MYDSRQWCSSGQCYYRRFIFNYDKIYFYDVVITIEKHLFGDDGGIMETWQELIRCNYNHQVGHSDFHWSGQKLYFSLKRK